MIVGHRMVHPLQRTPKLASGAAFLLALSSMVGGSNGRCYAFTSSTHRPSMLLRRPHHHQPYRSSATASSASTTTALFGKKKTPGPNYSNKRGGGGGGGQPRQEKASVKEARFDAATRQFMFTLAGLTKTLPDKSKDILKNIHLSFYPGAKIGVVGLNGSGKVRTSSRQFIASGAFVREGGVCCVRFFFAVENTSLSRPRPAIIIAVDAPQDHGGDREGVRRHRTSAAGRFHRVPKPGTCPAVRDGEGVHRRRRIVLPRHPRQVQRAEREHGESGRNRRGDDEGDGRYGADREQDRGGESVGIGQDRREGDGLAEGPPR